MFVAPILIDRSMTNYSAGVRGNGNSIKSKMAAKYRDKRTFYHHGPRPISII